MQTMELTVTSPEYSDPGLEELDLLLDELFALQRKIAFQSSLQLRLADYYRRRYLTYAGSSSGLPYRSMVTELALQLRITERAAEQLLSLASKLTSQLCETAFALEEGLITIEQAKVIADECLELDPAASFQYEMQVLEKAVGSPWIVGEGPEQSIYDEQGRVRGLNSARLRSAARKIAQTLQASTLEEKHTEEIEFRRVEFEPADDGMAWLHLYGPAPELMAVHQGLTQAARTLKQSIQQRPEDFGHEPEALPVVDQLKFDIALDLLFRGDVSKKKIAKRYRGGKTYRRKFGFLPVRSMVYLTVPVLTLLGVDNAPAELHGYGPIDAETARGLTASASAFRRVLTDPETGVVMSVGRRQYRVSESMRQALLLRDQLCRFPGCGKAASLSDLDHTRAWQHGGETATNNLAHLCRRHHTLKHVADTDPSFGWSVSQDEDGSLNWRSPTGRRYYSHPATLAAHRFTPELALRQIPLRT